jgi:nucleoside-diphosphate-sugar epimerase
MTNSGRKSAPRPADHSASSLTEPGRLNVLVTHADSPIGRRLIQRLFRDPSVHSILAAGTGAPPPSFDTLFTHADGRLSYRCVDLTDRESTEDLFRATGTAGERMDAVVHIPLRTAAPPHDRDPAPLPLASRMQSLLQWPGAASEQVAARRTAEARSVSQLCLESTSVRHLIALGSAYVYRLTPGNANRVSEACELEPNPQTPELRSWVTCDALFRAKRPRSRLQITLLRVPTVVSSDGTLLFSPLLGSIGMLGLPWGFDPLCPLVSDHDVVSAVLVAVRTRVGGIFNIASREALPLSTVVRGAGRSSLPAPGFLVRLVELANAAGGGGGPEPRMLRHGFTLDTNRAQQELAFEPSYQIGQGPAGLQTEAAAPPPR